MKRLIFCIRAWLGRAAIPAQALRVIELPSGDSPAHSGTGVGGREGRAKRPGKNGFWGAIRATPPYPPVPSRVWGEGSDRGVQEVFFRVTALMNTLWLVPPVRHGVALVPHARWRQA